MTPRNANPLGPVFPSESVVSSVRMLTVWSWLKKLGGVLRVPRPRHPENDPEVAEKFKQELGMKVRVPSWKMLHT